MKLLTVPREGQSTPDRSVAKSAMATVATVAMENRFSSFPLLFIELDQFPVASGDGNGEAAWFGNYLKSLKLPLPLPHKREDNHVVDPSYLNALAVKRTVNDQCSDKARPELCGRSHRLPDTRRKLDGCPASMGKGNGQAGVDPRQIVMFARLGDRSDLYCWPPAGLAELVVDRSITVWNSEAPISSVC